MRVKFAQPLYVKHFAVVAATILITVLSIFSWFTWRVYSDKEESVLEQLQAESGHIEQSFSDIIGQTSFVMKLMVSQVQTNYEDKQYINNIISKYRTNPNIANILSWTIFSWANAKHFITVDALYGVLNKPIDLSSRDYIPMTVKEPGVIKFGKPVFGSTSKMWMIPAGIGATDKNNKFIGTMTIGFNIDNLMKSLKNSIKSNGVEFALIDTNLNIIMRSSNKLTELGENESMIPEGELKQLLEKAAGKNTNAVFSKVNIFGDYQNYYFYRMQNAPYIMYVRYDYNFIRHEIWHALTSRFIEVSVIGFIALLLSLFIYKREVVLRKAAEEAHKEAFAKSEFLAYTSHELRNPLNGIILGSEMIKVEMFGKLPEKYVDYAKDIHNNGVELLQFVEDLLDESHTTAGSFSIIEQETNIENIIKRAIHLNSSRANKHQIVINVEIEPDLPLLWIDPKRFRQILSNLISNSVKYSPPDTVITVSAKKAGAEVLIIVEDQGFGMTEEDLQTALSKYGTVTNKNTGLVESVGLGLPLVKHIVESHSAKFIIESAPAKGTKVTIELPKERVLSKKIFEMVS